MYFSSCRLTITQNRLMLPPIARDYIFDAIKSLHNITFICYKTTANQSLVDKSGK
jgi:hypothetical protein